MDFVALISGGKDSCYNIWKCQQYGHRLVCLANLQSPQNDSENEEINSFMYQSAGSSVIPAYAECLQVPLLRRVIQGKAVSQTLYYENEVRGDEVEDLYELLKDVKQQFPTITAVSCGAIVSNYQRHRVENICQRLGWTCLSYLWQRDRNELIHEIVEKANIHAILIKVAGAGLDPNKHLKRTLKDLLPTLNLYHNKYGLDVCGEGGEYESLVLDAPFFLKKIELIDTSIIYDDEDPSVGMLKILSWKIVDKDIASLPINNNPPVIPFPPAPTLPITTSLSNKPYRLLSLRSNSAITIAKNGFGQTGLIYPRHIDYERTNDLVIEQVEDILEQLKCLFSLHNIHFLDSLFIHLYISDMSLFNIVNNTYCRYFEQYPPSRCCVEAVLPDGVYVALYSTFQKNSYSLMKDEKRLDVREVVHVRSMSEWAPLCIGPYSQSNRINNSLVFVAGQIPLDPARMQLTHPATPQNDSLYLLQDIYLSLRHINNVLDVNKSNANHLMFMIIYVNNDRVREGTRELEELFRQAYNHLLSQLRNDQGEKADPGDEDYSEEEQDEVAPDNSPPIVREVPFPLMIVRVPGLPRNASVELESIGCVEKTLPDNGWISKKETFIAEDFRNREIFNPLQPPNLSCNNQLFSIESSSFYYPRCLSSHALQLVLSDSENFVYDERVLVEGLMLQLKMCCKEAGVKDASFISITIFYDILLFGKESLQNILYFYFGKYGFSMDSVSLVLIPIGHSFQFSERRPLQLLMNNVDFEQIETESWIYNK